MKPVKIYSIHFDRPEFIQWQYDSLFAHCLDSFEYIVVNNAKDQSIASNIDDNCARLHVKNIRTESAAALAGKHHVDSFNKIWKDYIAKDIDNYSIIMDGDCFLIKKFCVNDFMNGYALAGPKQQRNYIYHYLTPTIIIADSAQLPDAETIDWEGIGVDGIRLDTGGGLYNYYQNHKEIKNKTMEFKSSWHIKSDNNNRHCIPDELLPEYDDNYNIEFFGNEFLHYCRSSNWDYQTPEHHVKKAEFVKKFIYEVIYNKIMAKEHNFQIDNSIYFGWGK